MPNKMLIDASHPEETRVVVVRGNRVEEFDFESATRKQLRGNIYLAKVTRVEPSLQAAFIEYGGNRHGFLAFSEIHPDYYQIPVADRQALIEAEEAEAKAEEAARKAEDAEAARAEEAALKAVEAAVDVVQSDDVPAVSAPEEEQPAETADAATEDGAEVPTVEAPRAATDEGDEESEEEHPEDVVESVGAEDALEELPERRRPRPRQYKIQEVIRRRQVLLVQVVKEERGTKGAALTTYLSLAGRYSVLMPNTARGGGISRKITNAVDRKRLKSVVSDLDVPEGMGVILRTAGANRTKPEVKRDFEYLLRLWESVRELTLRSSAPALVYEEGSLIKRSIRDLYSKDIEEILVAGDDGYREAKDFMRMLMPSHAKNVQPYRESQPLFARYGIEPQLDAMFSPHVALPSGGYIVINQTEALVSIDVNSGRSTREHNIEDTALHTNLQACDEVARQLRLRDLAGLIVIDFIDMEERRNNRSVEKRIKDALKDDRARIQVGRISHFGLLEMSRQRIRTGVLESTTEVCPHCMGTGHVRSPASVSLHVLRSLEDQLLKSATHNLTVRTKTSVALYILNQKRAHLSALEQRFGLQITIAADETVTTAAHFVLERGDPVAPRPAAPITIQPTSVEPIEDVAEAEVVDDVEADAEAATEARAETRETGDENGDRRRRRRRRRRRGGDGAHRDDAAEGDAGDAETAEGTVAAADASEIAGDAEAVAAEIAEGEDAGEAEGDGHRRRRRGRRGGRRTRRGPGDEALTRAEAEGEAAVAAAVDDLSQRSYEIAGELDPQSVDLADEVVLDAAAEAVVPEITSPEPEDEPAPPRRGRSRPAAVEVEAESAESIAAAIEADEQADVPEADTAPVAAQPPAPEPEDDPSRPKRGGWWQRRSFF
ncbi:MAG: ribonuclease E/G [Bauldia sp.]